MLNRSWTCRLAAGFLAALFCVSARAESAPASGLSTVDEDLLVKMMRPRAVGEIDAEIDRMTKSEERAGASLEEVKRDLALARQRLALKKSEIATLKERVKLARKEKDEPGAQAASQSLAREKDLEDVFEALTEVASTSVATQEATRDAARARLRLLENEKKAVAARQARVDSVAQGRFSGNPAALGAADQEVRDMTQTALSDLKSASDAIARQAKAVRASAQAKLDLLQVWETYQKKSTAAR